MSLQSIISIGNRCLQKSSQVKQVSKILSCNISKTPPGKDATSGMERTEKREPRAIPRIPLRSSFSLEDCETRRQWVEDFTGADTSEIGGWWGPDGMVTEDLKGNIEMPVGIAKIPLAVAGPIDIYGEHADGQFVIPLATTEGALVASIQRGCTAINMSGGVKTITGQQHMTRSPFFITDSAIQAARLAQWIKDNMTRIQEEVVPQYSRHAKLTGLVDAVDLSTLHLLLQYETGDAAGQNMVTVCSMGVTTWIVKTVAKEVPDSYINIRSHYVEGNLSSDKKTSAISCITGRGIHAAAECTFTHQTMHEVFNTSVEAFYEHYNNAARMSQRVGMVSFSANAANVMAACFAATGNDIACVGESAHGVNMEALPVEEGVRITYNIPSMVVGTVGGGTNLPTQSTCLDIMGCRGVGKVRKFAEIIAAYCLGLDMSTMSAISAHQFASAHDQKGKLKK